MFSMQPSTREDAENVKQPGILIFHYLHKQQHTSHVLAHLMNSIQGGMRRIQIILIYLGFLGIYVEMTVITVVIAGGYLMEITSECEARILYMIKARLRSSPSVDHTHHCANCAAESICSFCWPCCLLSSFFIDRFLQESLLWSLLLLTGLRIQNEWIMFLEEKAVQFK